MKPRSPHPCFCAARSLVAVALTVTACFAWAQPTPGSQDLPEPNDEQLRSFMTAPMSNGESSTRGFRAYKPTQAPSAQGLCQPHQGKSQASRQGTRSLVVVPYVEGMDTPSLDMPIGFSYNSDQILPGSQPLLDKLAAMLTAPAQAELKLAIAGHTDPSGSEPLNKKLSCARAMSVVGYLARKGVAPERLTAYGFGSDKPVDSQTGASLRRVELRRAN
jgi:outer membrane protein OmpA-like peptidoglycan-associated protein